MLQSVPVFSLLVLMGILASLANGGDITGFSMNYPFTSDSQLSYVNCMVDSCVRLCSQTAVQSGTHSFVYNRCSDAQLVTYACQSHLGYFQVNNVSVASGEASTIACNSAGNYYQAFLLSSD